MADWNDMVLVGRIARPHGLRGDVFINPETDFIAERFRPGESLWTRAAAGDEQLTIARARLQQGRPVVSFEGFDSIEAVERLAGAELRVPDASLQPLEAGTYYHHQLIGCTVESTGGRPVGQVVKVEGGAGGSCLVVQGPSGEVLIPLAVDICVEVDVGAKRIRIDPPEGLLELNEREKKLTK
jgi:16S rRNA processing protein RimM